MKTKAIFCLLLATFWGASDAYTPKLDEALENLVQFWNLMLHSPAEELPGFVDYFFSSHAVICDHFTPECTPVLDYMTTTKQLFDSVGNVSWSITFGEKFYGPFDVAATWSEVMACENAGIFGAEGQQVVHLDPFSGKIGMVLFVWDPEVYEFLGHCGGLSLQAPKGTFDRHTLELALAKHYQILGSGDGEAFGEAVLDDALLCNLGSCHTKNDAVERLQGLSFVFSSWQVHGVGEIFYGADKISQAYRLDAVGANGYSFTIRGFIILGLDPDTQQANFVGEAFDISAMAYHVTRALDFSWLPQIPDDFEDFEDFEDFDLDLSDMDDLNIKKQTFARAAALVGEKKVLWSQMYENQHNMTPKARSQFLVMGCSMFGVLASVLAFLIVRFHRS